MSSSSNTTTSRIKSAATFVDPENVTELNGIDVSKVDSANGGTAAMFALSGIEDVGITSARKVSGVNGIVS
ncbi:hypothetical protein NHQ30_006135 [Ciborinia camelliae]|nr:hypothetical protein NHQ30_006135 [Ciborinia camelliae]